MQQYIMRNFLDKAIIGLDLSTVKLKSFHKNDYGTYDISIGANSIIAYKNKFFISNQVFIKNCSIEPSTMIFKIIMNHEIEFQINLNDISTKSDYFNYIVQNECYGFTFEDSQRIRKIIDVMNSEIYDNW